MIDPKELRIGNLVGWGVKSLVINGIHTNNILRGTKETHVYCFGVGKMDYHPLDVSEIDPIPITPEWLERLGFFKYHRGDLGLGLGYFELEFSTEKGLLYLGCNEYEDAMSHIKSVHQLQNLYFTLTGEELTIRPETAQD